MTAAARRKLAKLTPEEDKVWVTLFAIAINGGASSRDADREAWEGLCEQFPELKEYDGALA
jgi:hypothetical protein